MTVAPSESLLCCSPTLTVPSGHSCAWAERTNAATSKGSAAERSCALRSVPFMMQSPQFEFGDGGGGGGAWLGGRMTVRRLMVVCLIVFWVSLATAIIPLSFCTCIVRFEIAIVFCGVGFFSNAAI